MIWPFLPAVVVHCYWLAGEDHCVVENRDSKAHTLSYPKRKEPIPFSGGGPWSFTNKDKIAVVEVDGRRVKVRRIGFK